MHLIGQSIKNRKRLRIFGATGGRFDHMFANIQLLINPSIKQNDIQIEIIDHQNIIQLKAPWYLSISENTDKKYISFIPISAEVKGLTLNGFKYPLTECHISSDQHYVLVMSLLMIVVLFLFLKAY